MSKRERSMTGPRCWESARAFCKTVVVSRPERQTRRVRLGSDRQRKTSQLTEWRRATGFLQQACSKACERGRLVQTASRPREPAQKAEQRGMISHGE